MTPTPQEPGTALTDERIDSVFEDLFNSGMIGAMPTFTEGRCIARALLAAKQPEPPSDKVDCDMSLLRAGAGAIPGVDAVPAGPTSKPVATALRELVEAVTAEVNEKGAGGYLLARLTDARAALAAVPLPSETPCK